MTAKYARNTFNQYTRIEWGRNERETTYLDCFEMDGLLQYMKGHDRVIATFGQFERAYDENGKGLLVRWTVYLGSEHDRNHTPKEIWLSCHESSSSEYDEDLKELVAGNVDYE